MNLPNKITLSRFAAAPLFLVALIYYDRTGFVAYYVAALVVFTLASISDGLDGYIARTRKLRTRLGTILDPLADKLFLDSAVSILAVGIKPLFPIPAWFAVLIISRDLLIVGGALIIRFMKGRVEVDPSWWGKGAAVLQMASVLWILFRIPGPETVLYATALITVISTITYIRSGIRQLE
jgi:cardiolipin synthase